MACLYDTIVGLSPTSYWPLSDAAGTTAADAIGSSTITLVNGATLGSTGLATGDSRTACAFVKASTQYGTTADIAALDLGDTFSILAMFQRTSVSVITHIVNKNSGADGYALWIAADGTIRLSNSDFSVPWVESNVTHDDTTTHMVLATKAGATRAMYIDGADDTFLRTNATATDNAGLLYMAAPNSGLSNTFDGTLQHVAFWKGTALSSTNASDLWNARTVSCFSRAQEGVDAGVSGIVHHGGGN